jgi:hypothetical protein
MGREKLTFARTPDKSHGRAGSKPWADGKKPAWRGQSDCGQAGNGVGRPTRSARSASWWQQDNQSMDLIHYFRQPRQRLVMDELKLNYKNFFVQLILVLSTKYGVIFINL